MGLQTRIQASPIDKYIIYVILILVLKNRGLET